MTIYRTILILAIATSVNCDCSSLDRYFQIKVLKTDLYAYAQKDEIGNIVTIEKKTSYTPQYWYLIPSIKIGCFNIMNYYYEWALDVDLDNVNRTVTLKHLEDTPTQQWFINSEGTIMNVGIVNHTLDVWGGTYGVAGSILVVFDRYDNDRFTNELFQLVY